MTPVLVLCILLCAASAAPTEKENLPADVSEPQEEMMKMMIEEEEQELPEDLVPELIDGEESGNISLPAESKQAKAPGARYFCPVGWHQFSGFCYKVSTSTRSWFGAAEDCYGQGAQLASVTNSRQYSFLQQLSSSLNVQYAWLGGFYVQDRWMWTDGQSFSYYGWAYQSTPQYIYSCVFLNTYSGWGNNPCSYGYRYICARSLGC